MADTAPIEEKTQPLSVIERQETHILLLTLAFRNLLAEVASDGRNAKEATEFFNNFCQELEGFVKQFEEASENRRPEASREMRDFFKTLLSGITFRD